MRPSVGDKMMFTGEAEVARGDRAIVVRVDGMHYHLEYWAGGGPTGGPGTKLTGTFAYPVGLLLHWGYFKNPDKYASLNEAVNE